MGLIGLIGLMGLMGLMGPMRLGVLPSRQLPAILLCGKKKKKGVGDGLFIPSPIPFH